MTAKKARQKRQRISRLYDLDSVHKLMHYARESIEQALRGPLEKAPERLQGALEDLAVCDRETQRIISHAFLTKRTGDLAVQTWWENTGDLDDEQLDNQ